MEKTFDQFSGFRWDGGNIDKNLIRHNVENWECEQIFFNRPLIVLDDLGHSESEKRWVAFGKTDNDRFLVVFYTKRKTLIRIISARDMTKRERIFYYEKG